MKRIIRYTVLLVNLAVALVLVLCYFAPEVNPNDFWLSSFLGLGYIYVLAVNVVFVILWLFFYWKYLFISLIVIALGYNTHQYTLNYTSEKHTDESGIKVLSYNVLHFYSFLKDKNADNSVLDFIASQNADIICLQETKLQKRGELNPLKLKKRFPGIVHCQLAHQGAWAGPVTFSRFPILKMGEIRFEDSNNLVIYTDVKTPHDTLRVYNCHLQSFGIIEEKYSVIDSIGFESEKLNEVKVIGLKLREAFNKRAYQVLELKEHILACPYPTIVCGDFNDTPMSFVYNNMIDVLNDSFVESGCGISTTYRGKLPPYRIDYIFHTDEFESFNYKRHLVEFSDHYPITTTLVWK